MKRLLLRLLPATCGLVPLKPLPPLGCKDLAPVCECDRLGEQLPLRLGLREVTLMKGGAMRFAALMVLVCAWPVLAQAQSLADQKLCADAAREYFRDNFKPDASLGESANYTNHLNVRLGKCLIQTIHNFGDDKIRYTLINIRDAFDSASLYATIKVTNAVLAGGHIWDGWFLDKDGSRTYCNSMEECAKGTAPLMAE